MNLHQSIPFCNSRSCCGRLRGSGDTGGSTSIGFLGHYYLVVTSLALVVVVVQYGRWIGQHTHVIKRMAFHHVLVIVVRIIFRSCALFVVENDLNKDMYLLI